MKNVMIDLETLGITPNAVIISIGACYFNVDTGEIGDTFYSVMDWEDIFKNQNQKLKRIVSIDTIKWWMKQSDESRLEIISGTGNLYEELCMFREWFDDKCCPWGNGSTFDISMLEHAYNQIGEDNIPWKFWSVRDVRTVKELAKAINYDWKANNAREGVYHNALDDAIYQAQYVSDIWQQVVNGR